MSFIIISITKMMLITFRPHKRHQFLLIWLFFVLMLDYKTAARSLLEQVNELVKPAITNKQTNKQTDRHALKTHGIRLSHPCWQMSHSELKHTNTLVLLLPDSNYSSTWIFLFFYVLALVVSSGNQNTPPAAAGSSDAMLQESRRCLLAIHALT